MTSTQYLTPVVTCNTGRRREEIDYDQSKKNFLKLAEDKLRNHKSYRQLYLRHSKRRIELMISQIITHPLLPSKYKVIEEDGKLTLVNKKKTANSYIQVLSWEDMFDIIMPIHVRSGHRGRDVLKMELLAYCDVNKVQYSYPNMCLDWFRRACNVCVKYSGRYSLLKTAKTGIMHVITMIPTRTVEKFRYLLIYADKETNYIILRPITEKSSLEISVELLKIFTQFGPPMQLQIHGYNPALTEKIKSTLDEICPKFKVETEHRPSQYELPALVTDRIQSWMVNNKSLLWEVGCFVVQAEMNNDPERRPSSQQDKPRCTPHALYFHTKPDYDRDVISSKTTEPDCERGVTSSEATKPEIIITNETDHIKDSKNNQTSEHNQELKHNCNTNQSQNQIINQSQSNQQQVANLNRQTNENQLINHDEVITLSNF